MVVPPLTQAQMLEMYPYAIEGEIVAVEQGTPARSRGLVFARVKITVTVRRVRKGWARKGEHLVFHGQAMLANDDHVVGPSGTVPTTLAIGQTVVAYLERSGDRLVVPHYSALAIVPQGTGGGVLARLRAALG